MRAEALGAGPGAAAGPPDGMVAAAAEPLALGHFGIRQDGVLRIAFGHRRHVDQTGTEVPAAARLSWNVRWNRPRCSARRRHRRTVLVPCVLGDAVPAVKAHPAARSGAAQRKQWSTPWLWWRRWPH